MGLDMKLAANCNIYNVTQNEIRFRKGIWNYEEAILNIESLSDNFQRVLCEILVALDEGNAVDLDKYLNQIEPNEAEMLQDFFNQLKTQKFLQDAQEDTVNELLSSLIGGTFAYRYTQYKRTSLQPSLLITDSQSTGDYCMRLANDIHLPLSLLSSKDMKRYEDCDLTTRYDGLETSNVLNELSSELEIYQSLVVVLSSPHISLLRNLNRVAVKDNKMITFAFVDGPFLTAFTIKPNETGCFECYENRVLARIEDLSAYRKFATKRFYKCNYDQDSSYLSPMLNTLASIPVFEAFMYACTGKTKLTNRVLNIFIPSLEIQVQDLLRIPSCPACGSISLSKMEDMYTSSSRLVENLVNSIILKE